MEWLILALAMPVIIVVVVLLYGFIGCDAVAGGFEVTYATTDAATDFQATANGTDKIDLTWQHKSSTAQFTVTRTAPTTQVIVTDSAKTTAGESGLKDGTDFTYALTAKDGGRPPSDPISATVTTKPKAPVNLVLTPQTANQIDLKWDHVSDSNKTITFRVEHRPKNIPGSTFKVIKTVDKVSDTTTLSHKDPSVLTAGSEHEYRVTAVILHGFVNSLPDKEVSSDPVTGSTKTWAVAFEKALADPQDLRGFCLVQRIKAAELKNSGTKVRVTVRGSGNLTLDKVYISQAAASGDPWDSAPPPSPGLTPVASGVVVPPGTPTPLDVDYTIPSPPQDLLIAFDISNVPGQGNVVSVALPGSEHYFRADTQQASTPNRSPAPGLPGPGFTTGPDRHYLVEKIEVL